MNPFDFPPANSTVNWQILGAISLALSLPVIGIIVWAVLIRNRGQRKRRKHRKHRRHHHNPTLAQTGGLPPARPRDQPPRGT
jgi:hypothetical protein